MIIKIATVGSNHGHNAINYAMDKDKNKDGKKPIYLASGNIYYDDLLCDAPSPPSVWKQMKEVQSNSRHRVKDGFFRIEICPPGEKTKDWKQEDWKRLLDDAIRHLDSTDMVGKNGKIIGHHADIASSQWVATIHKDTDNWHIHLIVNRITEKDGLQDSNQCKNRGIIAANKLAEERGWGKAQDLSDQRKTSIHSDAIKVLQEMSSFSVEDYFNGMRRMGWSIEAKYDADGVCRGYSVGEDIYKPDGSLSSTILYQASKLGFGRDLMVSKLKKTWEKLHPKVMETPKIRAVSNEHSHFTSVETSHVSSVVQNSEWKCSNRDARETWREEPKSVRIPDVAFSVIDREVKELDKMAFYDRNEDIPGKAAMVAVAVFEFLVAADTVAPNCGAGGGSSSDLRWDGKTEDDLRNMARLAASKAMARCTAGLTKRRGLRR